MKEGIFIPGNASSSKNSKVWTGRMLIHNKQTRKYIKDTEEYWIKNKKLFLNMIKGKEIPYKISLFFIRDSKRRFDYQNVCQIVFDLMQLHEWIEDDSAYNVIPVFEGFSVDKQNAGVIIKVL